ncbi:uncharacterized protein LOC114798896 isoform X2 [Denticeps clupeoides]|nr:uncharacterized protein LOC114798896 isoform X2 [Denticeps clupeoides]
MMSKFEMFLLFSSYFRAECRTVCFCPRCSRMDGSSCIRSAALFVGYNANFKPFLTISFHIPLRIRPTHVPSDSCLLQTTMNPSKSRDLAFPFEGGSFPSLSRDRKPEGPAVPVLQTSFSHQQEQGRELHRADGRCCQYAEHPDAVPLLKMYQCLKTPIDRINLISSSRCFGEMTPCAAAPFATAAARAADRHQAIQRKRRETEE